MSAVDQVTSWLKTLGSIDIAGAIQAVETGNVEGIVTTVEEGLTIAAEFDPTLTLVVDAIKIGNLVYKLELAGVWRPAQPEDPGMNHVGINKSGGK